MSLILRDLDKKASDSVALYWQTLEPQGQMDGFAAMVRDVLIDNGLDDRFVVTKGRLSLPGYFRATKRWDMLVVRGGLLVAAIEFKSQRGPSSGDDLDAITLEALGTGHDFWAAYGGQSFGLCAPRPWLGWLLLVEDCPGSPNPLPLDEPQFAVRHEFERTTYLERYPLLLRKLHRAKLYDGLALVTTNATTGLQGVYQEPAPDLSLHTMLASLAGHVAHVLAAEPLPPSTSPTPDAEPPLSR